MDRLVVAKGSMNDPSDGEPAAPAVQSAKVKVGVPIKLKASDVPSMGVFLLKV